MLYADPCMLNAQSKEDSGYNNLMWVQFLTSAFCHHDFNHLSSNAFMLYVFGRIVEEEEGAPGVWGTYLVCALGEPNSSRTWPCFCRGCWCADMLVLSSEEACGVWGSYLVW